jgi:hypothetical protein
MALARLAHFVEHMRTRLAVAVLVIAVPAALVPVLAQAKSTMVIRLVSITTSNRVQDKDPAGPSRGDTLVTTSRLQNAVAQFGRAKGAVVGSDSGTVTLTAADAGMVAGTTKLPGGTIKFRGRIGSGNRDVIPVTGGTGRFAGARGTLTTAPLDRDGARASKVYRLTLP